MSASARDVLVLIALGKLLDCIHKVLRVPLRELLIKWLLRVRNKRGALIPLVPNRMQKEFERTRGGRDIVLEARQLGMTTWIAARFFIDTITHPGTVTVQVAHDQDSAEAIFRIVHRFLENLPEALRSGALRTSRANVRQIVFPELDSEYRVETAADPNAGRGLTIRHLHCSEVARWPRDAAETLASLRAAVPPDGDVVLESTPNGAAGCFYDEWQRAEETGYTKHFFPWWMAGEYRVDGKWPTADGQTAIDQRPSTIDVLTDEERDLMSQHRLSLEQIAFRRRLRADFRGLARQEYAEDPVSCFLASGECLFDVEVIGNRLAQLAPVEAPGFSPANTERESERALALVRPVEFRDNGRVSIWYPPQKRMQYVIGIDTAGGGADGDYACAQVVDCGQGRQCAELHGHFSPRELAGRVAALGHEYSDALLVVERNNHGAAVLVYLEEVLGYPHIFCEGSQPGLLTTSITRPKMLEWLASRLENEPWLFSSARLLQEFRSFVRHTDGSASAAAGAHDDCVMAMAFAHWVRLQQQARFGAREVTFGSFAR